MLTNKTIQIIKICLQTMGAFGNKKSKSDIKEALEEFNEYICDIEDLYDNEE